MDLYERYLQEYEKHVERGRKMSGESYSRAEFEIQQQAMKLSLEGDDYKRYAKNPARFIASGQRDISAKQLSYFTKAFRAEGVGASNLSSKQIGSLGREAAKMYEKMTGSNISSFIESLYASEEGE